MSWVERDAIKCVGAGKYDNSLKYYLSKKSGNWWMDELDEVQTGIISL